MANPIPANFNPQMFFDKTAYYGSQGRGLFRLTSPVSVLQTLSNPLVVAGWDMLQTGIMAKSITMAGYNLATFEEFSYIGPTRKHPHTQIFGPMTVDFYLMGENLEKAKALHYTFLKWQEKIAGARFSSTEADTGARSDSTFFAIEYYDNYVSEAEVAIYSPQDPATPIIWNKYREIYPQALGGLTTTWDAPDAPLTLSVTFEYFHTNSLIS